MGITALLDAPYYTGTGVTDVGPKWDAALNGRGCMIDWWSSPYTGHSEFLHASVPLLRGQADNSLSPSEASVNPADLWRRSQDTWHKGAGQTVLDRPDSDPARYDTSKGVDPWTRWQLNLLPDTTHKRSSVNLGLLAEPAGPRLYLIDGSTLLYTTDLTAWTAVTGVPSAPVSIASDGFDVWTAHGTDGVYQTTSASVETASYATGTVTLVGYVKGRLMAAYQNVLYNVTGSGALPTALFTHPNSGFVWVGFAEGPTVLYAAGYAGDKSLIYRTAVKADGTALDIPVVAAQLPDGEIVRSIVGYLGFVLIGSDKGFRFAAPDSNGDLTFGSLIPTSLPVRCFEPQDRFVWFGWTDYDATSTGLGRIDLSVFTLPVTPAYASDLMVTGQGTIGSVCTFTNLRVFTVDGLGVYAESATKVASGQITTGQITYALPDDKVATFVDVHHDGTGQHTIELSTDGGPWVTLDTRTTSTEPFTAGQSRGARFELRLTLTVLAGVVPVIRSVTLRSYPAVAGIDEITAPIMLVENIETRTGKQALDVGLELQAIRALKNSRQLVDWAEASETFQVVVEDYEWRPTHATTDHNAFNGTCVVRMKVVTA